MESPLIVHMFCAILDPALALYRIFLAGHPYLHDMHILSPSRDHERSMDENCCLFCISDTPVGSEFLFKVHGDFCDRDKYFVSMRFCVLTVVLMKIQVIWDAMPCLLVDMRVSETKTLIKA
jgi:hypothetical protein